MSGWTIVRGDHIYTVLPQVIVTPSSTVVFGPVDLLGYDKACLTIKNLGAVAALGTGSNAFATASVQFTNIPDSTISGTASGGGSGGGPSTVAGDWETDGVTQPTGLSTLGVNVVLTYQKFDDSRRWWRIIATVAGGQTTAAQGFLSARAV